MSHGVADQATANHQAIVALALRIRQQANIMAFSDTFFLLGSALVVALLASLMLREAVSPEASGSH